MVYNDRNLEHRSWKLSRTENRFEKWTKLWSSIRDEKFAYLHHYRNCHQPLTFVLRLAHVMIQFGVKAVDLYLQQTTTKKLLYLTAELCREVTVFAATRSRRQISSLCKQIREFRIWIHGTFRARQHLVPRCSPCYPCFYLLSRSTRHNHVYSWQLLALLNIMEHSVCYIKY